MVGQRNMKKSDPSHSDLSLAGSAVASAGAGGMTGLPSSSSSENCSSLNDAFLAEAAALDLEILEDFDTFFSDASSVTSSTPFSVVSSSLLVSSSLTPFCLLLRTLSRSLLMVELNDILLSLELELSCLELTDAL